MVDLQEEGGAAAKSDAELSVAIDNLQVMLDTQDTDLVIQLLQDNDWDESKAANAFYAHQA